MTTIEEKKKGVRELWMRGYSIPQIEYHIGMKIELDGTLAEMSKNILGYNFKLFYFISGMPIELID